MKKLAVVLVSAFILMACSSSEDGGGFNESLGPIDPNLVGALEEGQDPSNKVFQEIAKERYLTALRCEIKSSGFLLIKRTTKDIFTNNFNKVKD